MGWAGSSGRRVRAAGLLAGVVLIAFAGAWIASQAQRPQTRKGQPATKAAAAPPAAPDWLGVGGNAARTGAAADGYVGATLHRTWSTADSHATPPDPRVIAGSSLAADSTGVYYDHSSFPPRWHGGSAAKLSAADGSVAWNGRGGMDAGFLNAPYIAHSSRGQELWIQDDCIHVWNCATGAMPLGNGSYDLWGDLLADGARAYLANAMMVDGDPPVLAARDLNGGSVVWQKWRDVGGKGYRCSQFALCIDAGKLFAYVMGQSPKQQGVWCLDPASGREIWKRIGQMVRGRPSAASGLVFAAESTALVARRQSDGSLAWQTAGLFSQCPPLLAGGLCITDDGASIRAFDQQTGKPAWSHAAALPRYVLETCVPGSFTRLAAAMRSRTVVVTETDGLTVLNLADGSVAKKLPTSGYSTINPVLVGKRLYVRRLESGIPSGVEAWDSR